MPTAIAESPSDSRAQQTWAAVAGQLDRFHITRVAEVTHLDALGVPTFIAVRPDSHTLSVSQGKGASPEIARTSAVMESLETWHCERITDVLSPRQGRADQMGVDYPVTALPGLRPFAGDPRLPHWWVRAIGMVTGEPSWVPLDYLDLSLAAQRRALRAYTASTNGIAAGVDREAVTLHAMREIVERDAVSVLADLPVGSRVHIDLRTVPPALAGLVERLTQSGCWAEVTVVPSLPGVVTAVSYLYSESMPFLIAGSAARSTLASAVAGALLEAAQSRLALITGTREDAPVAWDGHPPPRRPVTPEGTAVDFADLSLPSDSRSSPGTAITEISALSRQIAERTGFEPLVVDLSHPDTGLTVRRVAAPGMTFDMNHNLPRTQG